MEKRVLVAAILSAVVVIVWFAVLAPPPARERSGTTKETPTARVDSQGTEASPATAVAEMVGMAAAKAPRILGTEDREVVIEGEGVRALVAARGGVIRSLKLADYKDAKGKTRELVRVGDWAPLSLGEVGGWNTELYSVEEQAGGVVLRWSDGEGNWATKWVSASKLRYGLEVKVEAGGVPARAGVVVGVEMAESGEDYGQFKVAGAVIRAEGKLEKVVARKVESDKLFGGGIDYAGIEDRYFVLALLPEKRDVSVRIERLGDEKNGIAKVVVSGSDGRVGGILFAGAKEHGTLQVYGRGLEDTLSLGFFGFLSVGFLVVLRWIYSWVANWGLAIIVLTAAIRVVLFPLNHKSAVAMKKMQALQPKLKAVQGRYQERAKKDVQVRNRMNQEVMQVYRQEGVNPMGGCLPLLVQLPILYALYTLFGYAIELRQAPFVFWIKDLSVKDPTYITPILMTATMVWQQMLTPSMGDPTQRKMFMIMPFIFGIMFMSFPSGLVLYWLVNNLFTIGQQVLTNKLLGSGQAVNPA